MKTLWDAVEADPDLLVAVAPTYQYLDPAVNPVRPSMTVQAPCCGRRCSADEVVDVRDVRGTWVRPLNRLPWADPDFLCSGCVGLLYSRKEGHPADGMFDVLRWTPARLAQAMGEPQEVIRDLRAREIVKGDHDELMGDAREAKLQEVRDGLPTSGPIPGTEPPDLPEPPRPFRGPAA